MMKKQFIVLGLGSFGASVAVTLQRMGCDVVAIDQDMECVEAVADQVAYAMQADIGNPELLQSLGSKNFDGIVIASSEKEALWQYCLPEKWESLMFCVRRIIKDMPRF